MSDNYLSSSQQLLIAIVKKLSEQPLEVQTIKKLDDVFDKTSRDQIFRTLKNLEAGGWIEQTGGGWMLSPQLTQISERLRLSIANIHNTYLGDHYGQD